MFTVTERWKAEYPEAHAGVLAMRSLENPAQHALLDERKGELEAQLRVQYQGMDRLELANHPTLQAYAAYYRRFDKTYHVQLQLESIAWKGKSIPSVAALVEAMFMAELENLLLTAGHDLDAVLTPIILDVARGDERYTLLRGQEQTLKTGDMFMADGGGVISSILYGPDQRTRITPETQAAVFTVYAPSGIPEDIIQNHLRDIETYVRMVAPQSETVHLEVYGG